MADFYINKLIVKGAGKKDAVAEFDRGLTIISGPSNTGKTTILRCIDYIFGSDNLPFSSATGYDTIMLFVSTEDGSIQFTRKLESNKIDVVSSDDRIESGTYKARNATKTMESISKVWLALIGIEDDHDIIANENFRPQHLDMAHLPARHPNKGTSDRTREFYPYARRRCKKHTGAHSFPLIFIVFDIRKRLLQF